VLASVGIEAWIERSRSKGYHVWVFASDWCAAEQMRRMLLGACELAGVPSKEVNPKSISLTPEQLGNFVRLPYFGVLAGPLQRQVIVDRAGEPYPLDAFVERAINHWTPPQLVRNARLQLYVEPETALRPVSDPRIDRSAPWRHRVGRRAQLKLDHGPRELSDRSGWLYGLGMALAEDGLDHPEIVEALGEADARWCGKYEARRDAQVRYEEIATKAMGECYGNAQQG
jgi:hypothetical protein